MLLQINVKNALTFLCFVIILTGCTKRISTIVGGEYDKNTNRTNYFMLPGGSTWLPGKWVKTRYNEVSGQQFFRNEQGIEIGIGFVPINNYEFNTDKSKKGFEFTKAFYEWDSGFFIKKYKLHRTEIESNESQNYIIWQLFDESDPKKIDTYFLFGEKNGFTRSFAITITDKWTQEEKIRVLKEMYLQN